MSPTVVVKASEVSVMKRREEAAHRVISIFEGQLPHLPLLCLLDREDWQVLRGPGMAANRGVYFRKDSPLLQQLPAHFIEYAFVGREPAFGDFVYLHGSTCLNEVGLTMTLTHELQHFVQHSNSPHLWAANTLALTTLQFMERSEFEALGLRACDIPHEREARIVAKEAAEKLFGAEPVRQYIDVKMAERVTEQDAKDWECIRGLVGTPYDLAIETKLFFPRLKDCRSALQNTLRLLQTDPAFNDVDLNALLNGTAWDIF